MQTGEHYVGHHAGRDLDILLVKSELITVKAYMYMYVFRTHQAINGIYCFLSSLSQKLLLLCKYNL